MNKIDKFAGRVSTGFNFMLIPIVCFMVQILVGYSDVFRIIFVYQFVLLCCFSQGCLIEKYKSKK